MQHGEGEGPNTIVKQGVGNLFWISRNWSNIQYHVIWVLEYLGLRNLVHIKSLLRVEIPTVYMGECTISKDLKLIVGRQHVLHPSTRSDRPSRPNRPNRPSFPPLLEPHTQPQSTMQFEPCGPRLSSSQIVGGGGWTSGSCICS